MVDPMIRAADHTIVGIPDQVMQRQHRPIHALLVQEVQVEVRNDHLFLIHCTFGCDSISGEKIG